MNAPTDADRDRLAKIVTSHVAALSEHFENAQILCSNVEQGGGHSTSFVNGAGNWYARQHLAREWVMYHDEQVKEKARKDFAEDDE